MKSEIPVAIYTFFFSLGIICCIIGLVYVNTQKQYTAISNNILSWFFILLGINFINLLVTFRFYNKRKLRRGKKGIQGDQGLRGLPGENIRCGSICGTQGQNNCPDDEKDKDGKCIISGGSVDENNNDKSENNNIQEGRCIFPFVYNYKNQYGPLKPSSPDWDENDTSLPTGGEKHGICATSLNENKTPKTWGYVVNSSSRAREMSSANQSSNRNEARLERNAGIVDIQLVTGDTSKEATCPEAYNKIEGDLNQGAGAYVYMCSKTGVAPEGVVNLNIVENGESCDSVFPNTDASMVTKLPVNLNKDTQIGSNNPKDLYLCIEKGSKNFLTDIQIKENDAWNVEEQSHYFKVNGDLNKETGGFPVFLYASRRQVDLQPIQTAFYMPDDEMLYFIKDDELIEGGKKVERETYYSYDSSTKKVTPNVGAILGTQSPKRAEAILVLDTNRVFIFKGSLVYEIDYKQNNPILQKGYPTQIRNVFPGIPSNIDAVYQDKNDTIYFFKNEDVYEFTLSFKEPETTSKILGSLAPNSPKSINDVFLGAPSYVDAVFKFPENPSQVFFIRGNQYWITNDFTIEGTYPKMVDDYFSGLNTTKGTIDVNRASTTETFTDYSPMNSVANFKIPSMKLFK